MQRGFIKFWRKAEDSVSWTRGLMYQGLIINLLTQAAWKKGSYLGRELLPGQFGTVMSAFAKELDLPRSTLQRMLAHLEADDFLKIENVGNRFVVITIINWHTYQESEKPGGQQLPGGRPMVNHDEESRATDGRPNANGQNENSAMAVGNVVNHWATDGRPRGQPSYNEEEVKKKEEDLITQSTTGNEGYARKRNEPQGECSDFPDVPGMEFQEFRAFYDEHCRAEAPLAGFAEYRQLRAAKRWPGIGRLCDSIAAHAHADPEGWKKFCPGMVKFLREQWWDKQPTARASPQGPPAPEALSPAEISKRNAEAERMLAALTAKSRRENAELLQGGKGAWNLSPPSAPRQRSQGSQ